MADKAKRLEQARKIPNDLLIDPKRDTTIKHIENPDPMLARLRESARAKSQAMPHNGCPHPMSALSHFVDRTGTTDRYDRPTNLFQCELCHNLLRVVDFWGNEASDA